MKINKLLFFLLALISFNSCVEYVDNGTGQNGPEKPEEQKFTAEHSNATEAKYVGDKFVFTAMLNSVDVTSTTKFKVNGTEIKGNTYTPHKTGSHSVVATMDNFTANFKFTVLEDEEPVEPTGNRIDYAGTSYNLDTTFFVLNAQVDQQTGNVQIPTITMSDGVTPALNWQLINFNGTNLGTATDVYTLEILVPFNGTSITYPFQATQVEVIGGSVEINGAAPFTITNMDLNFESTGNAVPQTNPTKAGTANYTSKATGANSGNLAELFWNGNYATQAVLWNKKAKGANFKKLDISKAKILNQSQIKNFKIVK
ncbi:hypothetical protein [Paenimyroides baculatum]|uniref:Uncharacterized protein n=1 Tax=Paenimyroides baculatum TaxID=2608000 RepID=A0A5M6CD26_9FLAO|nr:hypothetical protein [Paenimyroides baculatum]KAA5532883.1 hypothetical protein F0460_12610 [Paenimyroides baculatum]